LLSGFNRILIYQQYPFYYPLVFKKDILISFPKRKGHISEYRQACRKRGGMKKFFITMICFSVSVLLTGCGDSNTVALDCDKITQILYSFGGTSGPCGPDMDMWVHINGEITTSEVEAFPPEGESECAEPLVITGNIDASEAADLINAICEEYNATEFQQAGDCVGGGYVIRFLHEDEELGTTGNIACSNAMETSLDALYEIWFEITGG
jgi:hypothetical protein